MSKAALAEFADKVSEIMRVIANEFAKKQTAGFHKIKLTMPQIFILDFLYRDGESNMTDMAHHMNVTTAAITGLVDKLVRDRYAVRRTDSADRRIIRVRLTKAGSGIIKNIIKHKRKMIMDIFGKITQAEREYYLKILMHIREHIK